MRRWDRLLDSYIEEYRARGVGAASVGVDFTSFCHALSLPAWLAVDFNN